MPAGRFLIVDKSCSECGQKDCEGDEDCPAGPIGLADLGRDARQRELQRQREALHNQEDE